MSVPMALMDLLPVLLFTAASMVLMHDLYHMMSKGAFALLSAGLITVCAAGFYKALWKLLYALNICDFTVLNNAFFPMQTTGFILAALGMTGLMFFHQKAAYAIVPVYASSMPFVILMVLGTAGLWGSLAAVALRMKKKKTALLFAFSFACMMAMGYLSSRDFTDPAMNWIGEAVNTAGMLLFLAGAVCLHRGGMESFEWKYRADRS